MKKLLLTVFLLTVACNAFALEAYWDDPNPASVGVIKYRLYWAPTGQAMGNYVDVTDTFATVPNEQFMYGEDYDFTVTAFNAVGESSPSDYVTYTMPWPGGDPQVPSPVGGIQFRSDTAPPITDIHQGPMP